MLQKPTKFQRNLLQKYKETLSLSKKLFDLSVGTLLGDTSIQSQDGGKSFRLKFQQSDRLHRDYLWHLHSEYHDFVLSKTPFFHRERQMWSFQTLSHSEFRRLAEIFVLDHRGVLCAKHIKPDFVENFLTARGLAYWFMDDGGKLCYNRKYPRKGLTLNTHRFPLEGVETLCKGLEKSFGLDCWCKQNKKRWIIAISGHSHQKMYDLIGNYLIPSMRYKMERADDSLES
jgi:hypothetical protein